MVKDVIPFLCCLAFIAGCGGGGGGGSSASVSGSNQPPGPVVAQTVAPARNVLPISVNPGPANTVNLAFTSVTVCAPGSRTDCQTIDGVMVDTGSSGLRILASTLSTVSLPQQTDASGNPVAECAQFAYGFAWGAVKIADVRLAGEQANSLPIQVIGDPAFPRIPSACSSTGPSRNTVQTVGANAILGVGAFRTDCGDSCVHSTSRGLYYACASSGCLPVVRPVADQVTNPVSKFTSDNNGVMVQLPAIPATGGGEAGGALIFGIATQANNALGNASVFALNGLSGTFTTIYRGFPLGYSIVDTGSNALFFKDSSIPGCNSVTSTGFYCALSTQSLSATIEGMNGTNASITFDVANADSLLGKGLVAFSNLASPLASSLSFDWGLPFFFGRRVFVAMEGASVPGAPAGPFVAF